MVQIIQEKKKPSFGARMSAGLERGVQFGSQILQKQQAAEQMQRENQQLQALTGMDFSGITDPKQRQQLSQFAFQHKNQMQLQELKGKQELQKEKQKIDVENLLQGKSRQTIEKAFGKQFADLYDAAPVGGKTELLKHAIDTVARHGNLDDLLNGVKDLNKEESKANLVPENIPQMQKGKLPKDFDWPEFTKPIPGYTPKEWNEERKTWRKENSPVYVENKTKLKNIQRDELGIKKLTALNKSKKLPEGFERYLIDPETGDFWGIAQLAQLASPEAQEWVKEIARFQNRAKDAFGSRVTNFDLQSYMKQFPGLLNTPEGRSRILNMMKINNELDNLYETALKNIYEKYGLGGIPQEKAEELAQKLIETKTQKLESEFLGLDNENQIEEQKPKLTGRMIDVIGPDGETYEVDEGEVNLLPPGYRII